MTLSDLDKLRDILDKGLPHPQQVEIVGTSFGNKLQSSINTKLFIANILLFYLCAFNTLRYFLVGN